MKFMVAIIVTWQLLLVQIGASKQGMFVKWKNSAGEFMLIFELFDVNSSVNVGQKIICKTSKSKLLLYDHALYFGEIALIEW